MTGGLLPGHGAARALVDWLDASPAGSLPWRLRLRMNWNAFWFERLLRAQEIPNATASSPQFVMGFWRSGTTLLHNMLYRDYDCVAPATWQCHAPASFTLQRPPTADATVRRPMDDGIVHLLGPQEDEFALLLLGEPSLYRGFLDPSRLPEIADTCLAEATADLPRWIAFVRRLATSTSPLLLKSPNHVFRLPGIARSWPEARMVWICRPFAEVLASNLRMWHAMIELHQIQPGKADVPMFLEQVARRYRDVVTGLLDRKVSTILWIDYHDMIAAPAEIAGEAAYFLGLEPRTVPIDHVDAQVHSSRTEPDPVLPSAALYDLANDIDQLHSTVLTLNPPPASRHICAARRRTPPPSAPGGSAPDAWPACASRDSSRG